MISSSWFGVHLHLIYIRIECRQFGHLQLSDKIVNLERLPKYLEMKERNLKKNAGLYTPMYAGLYTPMYAGLYTPMYAGLYTPMYAGLYTPLYAGLYTPMYAGLYTPMYAGLYTPMYAGLYTPMYAGLYTPMYAGLYTPLYAGLYAPMYSTAHPQVYTRSRVTRELRVSGERVASERSRAITRCKHNRYSRGAREALAWNIHL